MGDQRLRTVTGSLRPPLSAARTRVDIGRKIGHPIG
jgi:hypothetical protein